MGHESEKSLAATCCARTPLYHRLRCLLFLPQDFASPSPLLIPDISWDMSHCLLARRRRLLEIDSSTHQKNLPACVLAAVMQSMAERLHAMNDVDGTTSGTHEVHSMYTPQFKVWVRPVCYWVPLEFAS